MVTPAPSAKTPPTVPAAVPRQGVPDESPGSAAPPPARTPDLPVNAPARKNGKTKRKAAGGPGTTGAAAVGPDVAESDGTEASAESGSDASDDVEAATTSAVNVLVAAEGKSPDKKPKKATTAGVLRDYIKSKIDRENAAAESTNCSGPSRDRADGNGVSDDAIRRAVLDMITAYTEKARRD
ncbi:hypothetical protein I4F81_010516 [Pyropia yezoensis]|uniref:Uncharacterized protein n=1 Tax=Pyropia yezoensis TaxID=2788 RepID=A0ACC3CCX8_PYRYE|nr:hypothetical protein I4F81_010516 [Neopyropia yezoensis]